MTRVALSGVIKIPSRRTRKSARCSHPLSASPHKTARTGGHTARKQSNSLKMQESRFFSINAQSVKERLNPQATSVPGHVTVAQGSATPESGCTLTNSRTDDDIDNRFVGLDGTVHLVMTPPRPTLSCCYCCWIRQRFRTSE